MHQIYHSIPVMTATGIFQINLKLIPAVIRIVIHENYNCNKLYQLNCLSFLQLLGTTLTYLVILYQFHS